MKIKKPDNVDLDQIVLKIKAFAARHDTIAAVYLFGSAARQKMKSTSDLDIAIMSVCDVNGLDRIDLETELSNLVVRDVDLVIFHQVGLLLQHQILKYGSLIYERDPSIRVRQETVSRREYLDTRHLYKKIME